MTTTGIDPDRLPAPPSAEGRWASVLGRRSVRFAVGLVLPVALVVAWFLLSHEGVFTAVQFPGPDRVWRAGVSLQHRGELIPNIWISARRVLVGFVIGSAIGLALGAVVGLSRIGEALLSNTIGAFRAVPSLAWVPLLILWMKIGEPSKVTLIAIGAVFPVYTTVSAALRHVDRLQVEAARAFGIRGLRLLTTVQLPAVVPSIFSGLRLALAQAWLFVVAAELIASSQGLGFLLMDSQNNGRTDRLLLAIVLLALCGKISDAVLGLMEKAAVRRWT